jgi:hypothetical protein
VAALWAALSIRRASSASDPVSGTASRPSETPLAPARGVRSGVRHGCQRELGGVPGSLDGCGSREAHRPWDGPGSARRVAEAEARLPPSGANAAQWGIDGLLNRGRGVRRSPHSRGVGVVEAVRVELGEDALAESARGDSEGHS